MTKLIITGKYENICCMLKSSVTETISLITREGNKSKKNWWTEELKKLKISVLQSRDHFKRLKTEESIADFKDSKKRFRRVQRQNIFNNEQNKFNNIEHLFTIYNKNEI